MKWPTKQLNEVADFRLGKMLDEKKNRGDLMPYLANVNVRWGEFDLSELREMRFEDHEVDTFGLLYGDIVMCEGGEPGRCAIWKEQLPGIMIQKAIHRIRPHACLNHEFLYYTFLYMGKTGRFSPLFTGATIKHLPREKLALLEVPVPPLAVQKSIGSLLSAYDDLIENNRRRMALLEESARLLYHEWFVRLRFPGHEHVRIVDGVPEGWERKTLGNCVTLNYGKALKADQRVDGPYPVFGSSGIVGYHDKPLVIGPGIVVGRKGNVGSVFWSSTDFYPIDTVYFISSESSDHFLYFAIRQMHFISTDVAVPGLNREFAYSRPLLLPSKPIRQQFEESASILQHQAEKLETMNQKLRAARDLLLPRLMSGEVAV